MRSLLSLSLFALSLFTGTAVADSHVPRRHHDSLARRARGDLQQRAYDNSRFTFYAVGLGACGQYNNPGDFIVALNTPQFGGGYPGPNCFKMITISCNGKTTQAQIMDQCPGCPYGGLDMSTGLFQYFADESVGVIYGSWWFNGDGGGGGEITSSKWVPPTTSQWQPPTTTSSKWTPPPTTEQEQPSTTSSWDPPSSTSSSVSSSSITPSSSSSPYVNSVDFSSGPASGLAVPTGVVAGDDNPQNVLSINQAIVAIGGLIIAGHRL